MKRVIAASVIATTLCACGDDEVKKYNDLFIGAVMDQTGNNSEASWLQAVELAVMHMNAALRKERYKDLRFKLVDSDSENDPVKAVERATDLVRNDKALALVLDTSQVAEAVNKLPYDGDETNDLDVPTQCGSCTGGALLNPNTVNAADPLLQAAQTNVEKWLSRTIMSTGLQAVVANQIIRARGTTGDVNGDGILKISAYGSNESFGSSTTTATINQAKLINADRETAMTLKTERILHVNNSDPTTIPFDADIELLTNNANDTDAANPVVDVVPDVIAMASFGRNHVAFIDKYKTAGKTVPVLHYQAFRFQNNLTTLGSKAEGEEGVSHAVIDGAAGAKFAADFKEEYGQDVVYRDSIYYDNAATLLLAILIAQKEMQDPKAELTGAAVRDARPCTSSTTPECLNGGTAITVEPGEDGFRAAISAIISGIPIDYVGASGPVNYDANGNVKNKVANYKVQGGKYVDLKIYDCVSADTCPATN